MFGWISPASSKHGLRRNKPVRAVKLMSMASAQSHIEKFLLEIALPSRVLFESNNW
jgi:hypothetical protein|tara:strand:- start:18 stop:185 length:168 start_codon:yes stop_codon:yes gene_type:complete